MEMDYCSFYKTVLRICDDVKKELAKYDSKPEKTDHDFIFQLSAEYFMRTKDEDLTKDLLRTLLHVAFECFVDSEEEKPDEPKPLRRCADCQHFRPSFGRYICEVTLLEIDKDMTAIDLDGNEPDCLSFKEREENENGK